jgi:hypothetical protein
MEAWEAMVAEAMVEGVMVAWEGTEEEDMEGMVVEDMEVMGLNHLLLSP